MKHVYLAIAHAGGHGFQEVNRLMQVVRLTDPDGLTIAPSEYHITDPAPEQPSWATDDDTPEPAAQQVTADEVRAETLTRLCMAFGARDQAHLAIKVQDAMMRAGVLTDKRVNGDTLTAAEEQEAQHLRAVQALYARLKAVGNSFEALAAEGRCPADFRADQHWQGA